MLLCLESRCDFTKALKFVTKTFTVKRQMYLSLRKMYNENYVEQSKAEN